MSSIVDALYELKYNPFEYGPYMASFFTHLAESENNLLLAQLVIPLCSHPVFNKTISGAVFGDKKRSSIWSIFDDRTEFYDLQERIDGFQILTEQCVQYCLVNDWLSVSEQNLSIHNVDGSDTAFNEQRSAKQLGRLFSGHSVVEIYVFLGVKPR
ncbi:three component ABC system middle component [Thioalkalivibrio sp. ALM2T]|uniref:three component ABC system middle component n=1 Tax=Thioalkalivibrio sp. ALM2T TaxID=1158184 RepID=UPI0009D9D2E4|nr:three component ABC system middle component [Thioalkalivibrio sp. ALM2T]